MPEKSPPAQQIKGLGFAIGFALALGAEYLALLVLRERYDLRLTVQGLGWLILPLAFGMAGAGLQARLPREKVVALLGGKRRAGLLLGASALWAAALAAYVFLAEPFGPYLNIGDWITIAEWLVAPPAAGLGGLALYATIDRIRRR